MQQQSAAVIAGTWPQLCTWARLTQCSQDQTAVAGLVLPRLASKGRGVQPEGIAGNDDQPLDLG